MSTSRYVLWLAYRGTNYCGWQRQPNAISVEETIDTALGTVLGEPIKLVGCGRTDAGVHASSYAAHFDYGGELPPRLLGRLNRLLPEDIALRELYRVPDAFHARFSATQRAYRYEITLRKDPFRPDTVAWLPRLEHLDREKVQAAARLLLGYDEFAPFCKSNADNYTVRCILRRSSWTFTKQTLTYHVAADRFLRGMVRLIVGMCLRVGWGSVSLSDVRRAMDRQERLSRPLSAPAAGLYLCRVNFGDRTAWIPIT